MFRRRWLLLLVLVLMPLSSCSSGGECDECDSDDDCNSGYVCVQFRDDNGNPIEQKRCGTGEGRVTCRVLR
jgi:hypothetical protein